MNSAKYKSKRLSHINKLLSIENKNDLLLELLAKRKGLVKFKDREYEDRDGNKFMKTPLGFIRKKELNRRWKSISPWT